SHEEMVHAIPMALAAGSLVPIFCMSAKKDIGVTEFLDAIAEDALSPAQAEPRTAENKAGEKVALKADEGAEFVGQVFKTINDKFVGNRSYIRVFSGKLTPDKPLFNSRTGAESRLAGLLKIQGKANAAIPEAIAGDIIAVAKVEGLHLGDTVTTAAGGPKLP